MGEMCLCLPVPGKRHMAVFCTTNAPIQCNTVIQPSCGVDLFWPAASTGSDLTVQLNIRVHFSPLVFDGWLDLLGQGTQIYKGGKGVFLANIGLSLP